MDVVWAQVEGYPDYAVSNTGQVSSLKTHKILKPHKNEGYLRVMFYHEGKRHMHYVHRLVAAAFLGDYSPERRIKHISPNRLDNRVENLVIETGGKSRYLPHKTDHEMWGQRVRVIETGVIYQTVRTCARHIKGDYSTIYACLRGTRKSHLGFTFEYLEE